ncbi:MAG TPA: isopentenyl-diphosphate Delta-isomerase [Phycisphaerae bacterium]|nr:isopentenyl-diphosphate Delta-isomerase [Phycisphaerae bacterium]
MPMIEHVILVNERDEEIGTEEKLRAHQNGGRLHRAFSIFIFNEKSELLLQRRAAVKYHFAGRWSNTCCGHPSPGEDVTDAAHRRLREEFGFCAPLTRVATRVYHAADPATGLAENEFLHIFTGRYDRDPHANPSEIDEFAWASSGELHAKLKTVAESFTPWFHIAWNALPARQ